jgi:hypothetical protein
MASAQLIQEIRDLFDTLSNQSLTVHHYSGRVFDAVFDITTADTFVAGVASRLIDGDAATIEEFGFIGEPMLTEGRWWRCNDGKLFDLEPYPEIKLVAGTIESLRQKCYEALTSN